MQFVESEALPKRRSRCWCRLGLSFGKSRDKFRSVGWIPHKYQRAFANFQFLFRAKRLPLLLRFSLFQIGRMARTALWCGTLWTSWPALRLQKREWKKITGCARDGCRAGGKSRRKLDFEDCLRWLVADRGDPTNSISFSNSPNCSRSQRNSPFCKTTWEI